jgi:hypothetical protein
MAAKDMLNDRRAVRVFFVRSVSRLYNEGRLLLEEGRKEWKYKRLGQAYDRSSD